MTKYAILVGDGMGDYSLPELDGRTILEAADIPNMDALAREGSMGLARTIPDSMPPGSDVANMSILGYDPESCHTGRGPLEAAAMGVDLRADEQAFRLNLVSLDFENGRVFMRDHAGGRISTGDAALLVGDLQDNLPLSGAAALYPGVSYRHLLTWSGYGRGLDTWPPHDYRDQEVTGYLNNPEPDWRPLLDLIKASWDILGGHEINRRNVSAGRRPANSIWPWGQGGPPAITPYQDKYGVGGAVVSAVDLIKGLGVYAGLTPLDVPGATGLTDTNFEGKVAAALGALDESDFVLLHVEAPDEAGHQGDVWEKIKAVELFDRRVVGPVREGLARRGDYRLLVLCDHFTPIKIMTHTREPAPFILYPGAGPSGRPYTEAEAGACGLFVDQGHLLPDLLFGKE